MGFVSSKPVSLRITRHLTTRYRCTRSVRLLCCHIHPELTRYIHTHEQPAFEATDTNPLAYAIAGDYGRGGAIFLTTNVSFWFCPICDRKNKRLFLTC